MARKVAHTPSSAYSDDKMLKETQIKDYWPVLYGTILIYWEVGGKTIKRGKVCTCLRIHCQKQYKNKNIKNIKNINAHFHRNRVADPVQYCTVQFKK